MKDTHSAAVRGRRQRASGPRRPAARLLGAFVEPAEWVAGVLISVRTFARSFFTMVGHVHRIDVESQRRGYRRRPGIRAARHRYGARAA